MLPRLIVVSSCAQLIQRSFIDLLQVPETADQVPSSWQVLMVLLPSGTVHSAVQVLPGGAGSEQLKLVANPTVCTGCPVQGMPVVAAQGRSQEGSGRFNRKITTWVGCQLRSLFLVGDAACFVCLTSV
jgi:hypothetical protein